LIVTSDGHEIAPGITIPDDARQITINADGEVYASFLDRVDPELLGRITLAGFANDQGWRRSARTCSSKRRRPARHSRPIPERMASARCGRAMWRLPPSMRCARSPN
jgi:flagellar basal body rod protein FlgG